MTTVITVVHVITCVLLVLMVLVQSGKGAEISASFGGSSQTVFGSSGGANFFVKVTGALAAIFFCTSLVLTIMGGQAKKSLFESSLFPSNAQTAPVQGAGAVPANPAQAPATPPVSGAAPAAPVAGQQQAAATPVQAAPAEKAAPAAPQQTAPTQH